MSFQPAPSPFHSTEGDGAQNSPDQTLFAWGTDGQPLPAACFDPAIHVLAPAPSNFPEAYDLAVINAAMRGV